MDKDKIKYRKIEILNARKEKKLTQKQLERRCFWTWPFGHVWKENTYTLMHLIVPESKTCLVCKKYEIYPRG